ncbi:MAG: hypothetical protein ACXWJD_11710 [Burkholderiaceae bacterium]
MLISAINKKMIVSFKKLSALFVIFSTALLLSCAEFKEAGRTIGHMTRNVTREIGHGTRDAAKEIGHGTRRVVNSIGQETEDVEKPLSDDGQ